MTAAVPGTRNSADLKTAIFPGCKEVEIVKGKKQTWMLTVETLQLAAIVFTLVDHAAPAGYNDFVIRLARFFFARFHHHRRHHRVTDVSGWPECQLLGAQC